MTTFMTPSMIETIAKLREHGKLVRKSNEAWGLPNTDEWKAHPGTIRALVRAGLLEPKSTGVTKYGNEYTTEYGLA